MEREVQLGLKRVLDLLACTLILVMGLPFLLLLGLLVKVSSPGPIFFVQTRIGRKEKPYQILKFRTMLGGPDQNVARWTHTDQERITRVGRWMRDFGLDELPQLVNILKGEMSIIGPRTPLPEQAKQLPPPLKRMFEMRPGVLSLAAIEGRRSLPMERRYELHARYVEIWSLKLDFKILWKSLWVVLRREAAAEKLETENLETENLEKES